MGFTNRKVVPSYLGVRFMGQTDEPDTHSNTLQLLMGEVKEIIDPTEKRSLSKKYLEYVVDVQFRTGNKPATVVQFTNCLLVNSFGGIADKLEYSLRADPTEPTGKDVIKTGSKVLLLCLHGNSNNAFIIGGLREDKGGDKKSEHHLNFEFNGAQVSINKDGELQVRYRGATKVDGTLSDSADKDAEGSTIIFTKEGGIKAYTKDEKQFVHLDHKNKQIDVLADEKWHVKVNKKLVFEVGDTVDVNGDSSCTIAMKDKVFINSAGVHVGKATDNWPLFSTYRQKEGIMNTTLSGLLITIAGLVTTAATTLNVASALHKIPIAGPIAGSVPLQAAAVALTTAGPLFAQLASAITQFEAGAPTYLSLINFND